MKNKATRGLCLLMCFVMSLSLLVACNNENDASTTASTAEPLSDDWVQGLPGYTQVALTKEEVIAFVNEVLGDEITDFNGDLSTLDDLQYKKVKEAAEVAGYAFEKGLDGITSIKKTVKLSDVGGGSVALSEIENKILVEQALGTDVPADFNGDLSTLNPEQLEAVEQFASEQGYVIDTTGGSPVVNKLVANSEEKLTTIVNVSEDEISKSIRSALGFFTNRSFDGDTSKLSEEDQIKLLQALSDLKLTNAQISDYWKANYPDFADKAPTLGAAATTTSPNKATTLARTTTELNSTDPPKTDPMGKVTTTKANTVTHVTAATITSEVISTNNTIQFAKNSWVSTYDATQFNGVALCKDSGIVVSGTSGKDAASKGYDATYGVIAKFDSEGNLEWDDEYGGSDGLTAFSGITVLNNGEIIVVGYTMATDLGDDLYKGKGSSEGIVIKYDSNGNRKWIKMVGGESSDMIYSVAKTIDGGYVIGGKSFSRTLDFSSAENTISSFVFKYDVNGNRIWEKMMGGTKHSAVTGLSVAPDGCVFASYSTSDSTGDFAAIDGLKIGKMATIVVKYAPGGKITWIVPLFEVAPLETQAIVYSTNGGCVVAGQYRASGSGNQYSLSGEYNAGDVGTMDGCIFKIREITYDDGRVEGQVYWKKTVAGFNNEMLSGIAKVDGGYIVSGYSNSSNRDFQAVGNLGDSDSFVYFINEYGKYQTMVTFCGSGADQTHAVCSNGASAAYVCGATTSTDYFFANSNPKSSSGVSYLSKIDFTMSLTE